MRSPLKAIVFLIVLMSLSLSTAASQVTDTLSYYYPYDPNIPNYCYFPATCLEPNRCEPIATWFTPDSAMDTSFNVYSVKTILLAFVFEQPAIMLSIHLDKNLPSDSNKVYEEWFSVDSTEVNHNFISDGIELFKVVDVSDVQSLQQIPKQVPLWVVIHEKGFVLFNSHYPYPYWSGHSFTRNYFNELGWWTVNTECDWITKAVLEYDHVTDLRSKDTRSNVSGNFELFRNYPNPFNSSTTITFRLLTRNHVQLKVYDVLGRLVKNLLNDHLSPASYQVVWDGKDLHGNSASSGVYFCTLEVGNSKGISKMLVIK